MHDVHQYGAHVDSSELVGELLCECCRERIRNRVDMGAHFVPRACLRSSVALCELLVLLQMMTAVCNEQCIECLLLQMRIGFTQEGADLARVRRKRHRSLLRVAGVAGNGGSRMLFDRRIVPCKKFEKLIRSCWPIEWLDGTPDLLRVVDYSTFRDSDRARVFGNHGVNDFAHPKDMPDP